MIVRDRATYVRGKNIWEKNGRSLATPSASLQETTQPSVRVVRCLNEVFQCRTTTISLGKNRQTKQKSTVLEKLLLFLFLCRSNRLARRELVTKVYTAVLCSASCATRRWNSPCLPVTGGVAIRVSGLRSGVQSLLGNVGSGMAMGEDPFRASGGGNAGALPRAGDREGDGERDLEHGGEIGNAGLSNGEVYSPSSGGRAADREARCRLVRCVANANDLAAFQRCWGSR